MAQTEYGPGYEVRMTRRQWEEHEAANRLLTQREYLDLKAEDTPRRKPYSEAEQNLADMEYYRSEGRPMTASEVEAVNRKVRAVVEEEKARKEVAEFAARAKFDAEPRLDAPKLTSRAGSLDSAIDMAYNAFHELEERLGVVLRPEQPSPGLNASKEPEILSELGENFRRSEIRVYTLAECIHQLRCRLDI